MFKQPIFGEDSSPHQTSMFVSGIITLILWIIFCLMSFFLKFKPKTPEYKEVQIVLASTPVEEKSQTEEAAAATQAIENVEPIQQEATEVPELPNPVETPVAEAKVEAPKETPAPAPKVETKTKTTPAPKATETPAKKEYTKVPEFQSYGKTVEEQMEEQFNKQNKSSKDIDDIFASMDDTDFEPTENSQDKKVAVQSSFDAASAGYVSKEDTTPKSGGGTKIVDNIEASDDTRKYLASIAKAQPYSKSSGGFESKVVAETVNSSGKTNIKMSNGRTRALLQPANPYITLPPDIADLVKEQKVTVSITIVVIPSGNVPRTDIKISPISALPADVRDEICNQLSSWLFDSDPDGATASATFEYTIQKK